MAATNSSGMIPQEFIDDLAARVNLVDFMTTKYGTKFKVVGSNALASCPSPGHEDRNPSFSVSTSKNLCNCHSCGFGGNIYKVVEELENVNFPDAVKIVANFDGIDVPGSNANKSSSTRRDVLRSMLESARDIFRTNYRQSENPEINRMISDRGFSPEIANKFQLGVALASWSQITNHFGNYNRAQLLSDSGLSVYQPKQSEDEKNKLYDRFRDALIFPIRDLNGSTVSFGARFKDGIRPKYINGIETELFKKHRVMYGLYETVQTDRKRDKIAVVEGYTDVISMHQAGLDYATASMGTALTEDQIKLLLRHTNDLVFCFDSDNAGRSAAQKALNTVLPFINDERRFSFCHLPAGHDPDSLLRQFGPKAMETTLTQSTPLSRYIIDTLFERRPTNDRESIAKIGLQFSDMLNQIPNSLFKNDLIKQFEQLTGIELVGALNVEFSTDGAQPQQLVELSDTIRRVTASQLNVKPNKINVKINSDCVRPANLNGIFVNQSSILQQSLPAGSPDTAYINLMNTAAEHIVKNLSLSIKDSSGIPLNQLLVDAAAAPNQNPTINRLSALATSQLNNMLINNDIPHTFRLLANEIDRITDMSNHLAKMKSPQHKASAAIIFQIMKCADRSIPYLKMLSNYSPSNSYNARFNHSVEVLEEALNKLREQLVQVNFPTLKQNSPAI